MTIEEYLKVGAKPGDQLAITLKGRPMRTFIKPLIEAVLNSDTPFIRVAYVSGDIYLEGIHSIEKK